MNTLNPVENAIKAAGGKKADLARLVGISHEAIRRWGINKQIPLKRVADVSRLTGIPRHELRPDFWDKESAK